jgi:hypothetical protein
VDEVAGGGVEVEAGAEVLFEEGSEGGVAAPAFSDDRVHGEVGGHSRCASLRRGMPLKQFHRQHDLDRWSIPHLKARYALPTLEEEIRVLLTGLQWHQQHVIQHDVLIADHGGQLDRLVLRRLGGGAG